MLLHGTGNSAGFLLPLLNELHGVRAIAPDLPGVGLSDPIDLQGDRYRERAVAWLDRLLDLLVAVGRDPVTDRAAKAEIRALVSPLALLTPSGFRARARVRPDELRQVAVPTLVVWGERDPLGGVSVAQAIADLIPVLIVGAMIVSPDYGPMAALSVALANRVSRPAWQSFRALALGFPMAALAALLFTLAARGLGRIPAAYLAGERPLTGLLIGADLGAFIVAFVAGAAGIIALGRAKSGAVVTWVWARRIEAGQAILRPKPKPGR